MRNVINISLPEDMALFIKEEVRNNNFMSTSEFFRKLVREYKENKLLKELKGEQKELKNGKYKYANIKSLKDLK